MGVIHYGLVGLTYGGGYTYGQNVTPVGSPPKRMLQAALKLDEKDLDQCLELGVDMEEGLKNKPMFTALAPAVTATAGQRAAIATQRAKVSAAQAKVTEEEGVLAGLEIIYRGSLQAQAADAIKLAGGDVPALQAANIPLRQAGSPMSDNPSALENLQAAYGDMPGEIDWQCDGVGRRAIYVGEVANAAEGPFTQVYMGTRSRFTSQGHAPGALVYARMKCVRNNLSSPWSQVVAQRAP